MKFINHTKWYTTDLRSIALRVLEELPIGWQRNLIIRFRHSGDEITARGMAITLPKSSTLTASQKIKFASQVSSCVHQSYGRWPPRHDSCPLARTAKYAWAADIPVRAKRQGRQKLKGEALVRQQLVHAEEKIKAWATKKKRCETGLKKWQKELKQLTRRLREFDKSTTAE